MDPTTFIALSISIEDLALYHHAFQGIVGFGWIRLDVLPCAIYHDVGIVWLLCTVLGLKQNSNWLHAYRSAGKGRAFVVLVGLIATLKLVGGSLADRTFYFLVSVSQNEMVERQQAAMDVDIPISTSDILDKVMQACSRSDYRSGRGYRPDAIGTSQRMWVTIAQLMDALEVSRSRERDVRSQLAQTQTELA